MKYRRLNVHSNAAFASQSFQCFHENKLTSTANQKQTGKYFCDCEFVIIASHIAIATFNTIIAFHIFPNIVQPDISLLVLDSSLKPLKHTDPAIIARTKIPQSDASDFALTLHTEQAEMILLRQCDYSQRVSIQNSDLQTCGDQSVNVYITISHPQQ